MIQLLAVRIQVSIDRRDIHVVEIRNHLFRESVFSFKEHTLYPKLSLHFIDSETVVEHVLTLNVRCSQIFHCSFSFLS